jgi:hypothetical protein
MPRFAHSFSPAPTAPRLGAHAGAWQDRGRVVGKSGEENLA